MNIKRKTNLYKRKNPPNLSNQVLQRAFRSLGNDCFTNRSSPKCEKSILIVTKQGEIKIKARESGRVEEYAFRSYDK